MKYQLVFIFGLSVGFLISSLHDANKINDIHAGYNQILEHMSERNEDEN